MSLLPNLYLLLPPKHKHPKELNSFLQCFLILFWINLPKGDQWPTMYCYHYLVLHSVVASTNQSHNSPWTKSESEVAQLCPTLCNPMDCIPPGSSVSGDSPGKNTGVGCHALLQRIFPTQGSNPGVPHCRQILNRLRLKGSPRILEGVAYPSSRGSSGPRNRIRVSCIAGGFFTSWATRQALKKHT